jgi:hypothetical protein
MMKESVWSHNSKVQETILFPTTSKESCFLLATASFFCNSATKERTTPRPLRPHLSRVRSDKQHLAVATTEERRKKKRAG